MKCSPFYFHQPFLDTPPNIKTTVITATVIYPIISDSIAKIIKHFKKNMRFSSKFVPLTDVTSAIPSGA